MSVRLSLFCAALAALAAASAAVAGNRVEFTVKTRQSHTVVQPHPPAGGVGDTYVSTLKLVNGAFPQLGKRGHQVVGAMQLTFTIRKQCTSFGKTCVARADFETVTTLPGGTVEANGKALSIADPMITIPVVGGTGRYAGVTGTVSISPTSAKISTYDLVLR